MKKVILLGTVLLAFIGFYSKCEGYTTSAGYHFLTIQKDTTLTSAPAPHATVQVKISINGVVQKIQDRTDSYDNYTDISNSPIIIKVNQGDKIVLSAKIFKNITRWGTGITEFTVFHYNFSDQFLFNYGRDMNITIGPRGIIKN
ncbi:hypothetical protein ACFLYH_00910 [Candidatus Dependentiae bacterium]